MTDTSHLCATLDHFLHPVRGLLDDPTVSEIMINGPHCIFVERQGRLERTSTMFEDAEDILALLRNFAQYAGKSIDDRHPVVEGCLPDGSRLQAIIAPACVGGPHVAIRRFSRSQMTLRSLVDRRALSSQAASFLRALVLGRQNIAVVGGTGSGKTSLLGALLGVVPPQERLIVLEDVREVSLPQEHVLYLQPARADARGGGGVTMRELFRATLRMRPDRIVLGEIRGGEALELIQAMVSGHGGSLATLHATHPRDAMSRLEAMALMGNPEIPLAAIRSQLVSGLRFVVVIARLSTGERKVTHVTQVCGLDVGGQYVTRDLFRRANHPLGHDELVPTEWFDGMTDELIADGVLATDWIAASPIDAEVAP